MLVAAPRIDGEADGAVKSTETILLSLVSVEVIAVILKKYEPETLRIELSTTQKSVFPPGMSRLSVSNLTKSLSEEDFL